MVGWGLVVVPGTYNNLFGGRGLTAFGRRTLVTSEIKLVGLTNQKAIWFMRVYMIALRAMDLCMFVYAVEEVCFTSPGTPRRRQVRTFGSFALLSPCCWSI